MFSSGTVYSNIPDQNITLIGTGTGNVTVTGSVANTSTDTGVLVVNGGIGIANGIWTGDDIHVNGLTIGQGYEGTNNVVIRGFANSVTNDIDGENNIAIGYNTLLGLSSAENTIAIGRNALGTGTFVANTIAIGDSALSKSNSIQSLLVGDIVSITTGSTTTVTILSHGLSTGTEIIIEGILGTVELNNQNYLINSVGTDTLVLYSIYDVNLTTPIATTQEYLGGGNIQREINAYSNIAIGTSAGTNFYDGVQNFFIGHNVAPFFTTGSYNFFIGHEVGGNMISGDRNIAIGGNQLVNGANDQINIGSVFYYNGGGYLELNANTGVGLGDESTSTDTGAFNVYGGAGISGSLYVGGRLDVTGVGEILLSPTNANVRINPDGSGTVFIYPEDTNPGNMDNLAIGVYRPREGHFTNLDADTVHIASTASSTSTTTGALTVAGGVGVQGDLWVGGIIHGTVEGAVIANTSTFATNVQIDEATSNTNYYITLAPAIGGFEIINADTLLSYDTTNNVLTVPVLAVTSTASSTSTTTGALTVAGGVGIKGSVYSQDGNAEENYLVYSPKVSVADYPPTTATNHVGDYWINSLNFKQYQWIKDGTSTFWIQIAQL